MVKAQKGKYPYSYFIAAACFGIQAIGIGTYVSFGVLFNPLISEFGWSRAFYCRGLIGGFFTWGLSQHCCRPVK